MLCAARCSGSCFGNPEKYLAVSGADLYFYDIKKRFPTSVCHGFDVAKWRYDELCKCVMNKHTQRQRMSEQSQILLIKELDPFKPTASWNFQQSRHSCSPRELFGETAREEKCREVQM